MKYHFYKKNEVTKICSPSLIWSHSIALLLKTFPYPHIQKCDMVGR